MTLKNISIGKRLMGAFAIFTLIILIACAISFVNMKSVDKKANEITNLSFEKAMLASAILTNLQAILLETNKAVYTRDKAPLKIVGEKRKLYGAAMEKLEKLETEKEGKEIIDRFKGAIAAAEMRTSSWARMWRQEILRRLPLSSRMWLLPQCTSSSIWRGRFSNTSKKAFRKSTGR